MYQNDFDSLSQAVDSFTKAGYEEDFEAEGDVIIGNFSRKEYAPDELTIVDSYRFEGDTNPEDESVVFAIEARDGTKGTLVMTYGANYNQNVELIKNIPYAKK